MSDSSPDEKISLGVHELYVSFVLNQLELGSVRVTSFFIGEPLEGNLIRKRPWNFLRTKSA